MKIIYQQCFREAASRLDLLQDWISKIGEGSEVQVPPFLLHWRRTNKPRFSFLYPRHFRPSRVVKIPEKIICETSVFKKPRKICCFYQSRPRWWAPNSEDNHFRVATFRTKFVEIILKNSVPTLGSIRRLSHTKIRPTGRCYLGIYYDGRTKPRRCWFSKAGDVQWTWC
jgi:hypothetical protein